MRSGRIRAKQVFDFKTGEISAITLKRPGGEIQLARQGKGWEITRPEQAKADAATVEEMLRQLANLGMVRDLGPGDLKVFGLDQPALQVSFVAKGEQHRLALGEAVPASQGYYARKDDVPGVFIIATGARDSLNQQLFALRDRNLWAFNPDQVQSSRIRNDQNQVDLVRGNGRFLELGRTARDTVELSADGAVAAGAFRGPGHRVPGGPSPGLAGRGPGSPGRDGSHRLEPPGGRKSIFGGPDP